MFTICSGIDKSTYAGASETVGDSGVRMYDDNNAEGY